MSKNFSRHPLYRKWTNIREIFIRPAHKQYEIAQAQGWVCSWERFEDFARDVEAHLGLPLPGQMLIRRDQSRGFTLDNLVYGDAYIRGNKQRTCRRITIGSQTLTLKEWSDLLGIPYTRVYSRLRNYGWRVEEALELEPRL